MNKTKELFSKQKEAIKIIPMVEIHENLSSDEKIKHLDILNIYELNLYQILNIMFSVKTNTILETLQKNSKLQNTITLQDTVNAIPNSQISILGLLNLKYRHADHVSGICILTNF